MEGIPLASRTGRAVVAAAVLGSGMALLDGTVVNVAVVRIGAELGASISDLQWVTNAYLLALASLILVGGTLGDRLGRRRVFVWGVVVFALASAMCAVAQTPGQLIAARFVQGVGGALLTPGSLALIQASISPPDRARAIGAWSGLGGVAAALGPFVGGFLVQFASWRYVFALNLPLAVATVWVALAAVPESSDPEASRRRPDAAGAVLATVALALGTFALIEYGTLPACATAALLLLAAAAGVAFVLVESRSSHPMLPVGLFGVRQFSAANATTFVVYAALGAMSFFLSLQLQVVVGYGPLAAGLATLPMTLLLLVLAAPGGELGQHIGPRLPMTLGPLVCAAGTVLLLPLGAGAVFASDILPGVTVFGLGLSLLVAPLTATVLAAAPDHLAGTASGVNNAMARTGTLLAVAAIPAFAGLVGDDYRNPAAFTVAYRSAMQICAVLLVAGALTSWLLIRNPPRNVPRTNLPPPTPTPRGPDMEESA